MKSLILNASCMLILAAGVHAQQPPALPTPSISVTPPKIDSYNVVAERVHKVTKTLNGVVSKSVDKTTSYSYSTTNDDQNDDPMKSKTFSKSFPLDRSDKVTLANSYGSITVKIWAKNEIKVDAEIKAFANTESEAQDLLDKASISANKDGDEVSVKTKIEEWNGNRGSGSRNGKRWRRELKIYYTVYMPASNALNALQQYGNILMEDFSGPTSLKVQYGNLVTGDLKSSNNYISVQYGKATLQQVNSARIKHQYGDGLTIADINDLELDAQYTSVDIGSVKNNANIKHQYGKGVTIGSAGNLNVTAQYAGVKLAKLSGSFTGNIQYGRLTVDIVEPGCKNFSANTQYTAVLLGFAPGYNADLDVDTEYAPFKYGSNVTAKRTDDDDRGYSSSKRYSGQVGRGGSNKINLKVQYNSVTFK